MRFFKNKISKTRRKMVGIAGCHSSGAYQKTSLNHFF